MVLTNSTHLYQFGFKEIILPLGTILSVISKKNDWLHVQTAHGHQGYINSELCLEISFPLKKSALNLNKNIHTFIRKKLEFNGDLTLDSATINYNERNIDILYLQAISKKPKIIKEEIDIKRQLNGHNLQNCTTLIITNDYISSDKCTLSVKKGDTVLLIHSHVRGWFCVKNKKNEEGYIPTVTAAYNFIETK